MAAWQNGCLYVLESVAVAVDAATGCCRSCCCCDSLFTGLSLLPTGFRNRCRNISLAVLHSDSVETCWRKRSTTKLSSCRVRTRLCNMMSWSMTEFAANSTHMVDSPWLSLKPNWPMVPATQWEWSAQSLLQSFIRTCFKASLCSGWTVRYTTTTALHCDWRNHIHIYIYICHDADSNCEPLLII